MVTHKGYVRKILRNSSSMKVYSMSANCKNFAVQLNRQMICLRKFLSLKSVKLNILRQNTSILSNQFVCNTICIAIQIMPNANMKIFTSLKTNVNQKRSRSSRPEMFCKKGVLRNYTKFTGTHLCQSLFFNEVEGFGLQRY